MQEWKDSTESKSDFAARHGIGLHTFYNWTRKQPVGASARPRSGGFRAIPMEEAVVITSRPVAVIHYPSGIKLELHELPDPMIFKALLR